MDFVKTEILNPNAITHARTQSVDLIDPVFDADLDIIFSKNGVLMTLAVPIQNYQWIEFELENLGNQVNNLNVVALKNNTGTSSNVNKADLNASIGPRGRLVYKIPNIGVVEQILIIPGAMTTGDLIAVKRITVAQKNLLYTKIES